MIKKFLILALACASMAGCMPHFKEYDSYQTMFRNDEVTAPGKGDPYTFGGIAEGSGGTYARQSYATDNNGMDARDDTAKIGEIAKDRTSTPGQLPGTTGTLPGATDNIVDHLQGGNSSQTAPARTGSNVITSDQPLSTTGGGTSGGK